MWSRRQNNGNHTSWAAKREKNFIFFNVDRLRDPLDIIKWTNIHIKGFPEEGKRKF